jgi:hypothetical protein
MRSTASRCVITISPQRISRTMIKYPWHIEHLQIIYPWDITGVMLDIIDNSMIGLDQDGSDHCLQVLVLQFSGPLTDIPLKRVFECLAKLYHGGSNIGVINIKLLNARFQAEDLLFQLMLELVELCPSVQLTVEYYGRVHNNKTILEWSQQPPFKISWFWWLKMAWSSFLWMYQTIFALLN